ncbi:MAG: hypothetical protein U0452_01790 [Anaerolineae bacterium]
MNAICAASIGEFRGWKAALLENEYVRLAIVPDIGGRVMAYDLGDYPFLFVDPSLAGKLFSPEENQGDGSLGAWKNYGGDKTWPAPQGWDSDDQWHGPPDPILDTGRYTLDELTSSGDVARARVVSPSDARTGLQIARQFTLRSGTSRVWVDLTFRNVSSRVIRWGIWDVVQLRAERAKSDGSFEPETGCVITTPTCPHSVFPGGFSVLFGAEDNPQWQVRPDGLFEAPYLWQIGKVALDSPAGWVAFTNQAAGAAFATSFDYQTGAAYPDGGASVEIWTVGAGQVGNLNYEHSGIYLMEAEVLSPFHTIQPGADASFTLEWGSCRCSGTVIDVAPAGVLTQRLRAEGPTDGELRLVASGGVFDAGNLRLRWLDRHGQPVEEGDLGTVSPLSPVTISLLAQTPSGAHAAEISVVQPNGEAQHWAAIELSQGR